MSPQQIEVAIERYGQGNGPLPIGAWSWNIKVNQLHCDSLFADYFSLNADEGLAGVPIEKLLEAIHDADRPGVVRALHDAMATGSAFQETYRVNSRSYGQRLITAIGRCYLDEQGDPSVCSGFTVDVTSSEGILGELAKHSVQARNLALTLEKPIMVYLLDMILVEVEREKAAEARRTDAVPSQH